MNIEKTLKLFRVIWGEQEGFVFLPIKDKSGTWNDTSLPYDPKDMTNIRAHLEKIMSKEYNAYWCPVVFKLPRRIKENAYKPLVFWADLDDVDPRKLGELEPTVAWKSSDRRYQGLWAIDFEDKHAEYTLDQLEAINKGLTYKVNADKSGWDIGQVLRIPGSINYKYDPPQQGDILWIKKRYFPLSSMSKVVNDIDVKKPEKTIETLISGYDIPKRITDLLFIDPSEVKVGDRSEKLWEIETALIEKGVPVSDVIQIVQLCPYNKFTGRRNELEQIWKEVVKAEKHVRETHLSKVTITDSSKEIKNAEDDDFIKNFEELVSQHLDPPTWLVQNIWQEGTYGMIAGEPKTYKSVQSTDLCLSIASGSPFLNNFQVEKCGAVLYVQEENSENTVQDRVKTMAVAKGILSGGGSMANIPFYSISNKGLNFKEKESRKLLEQSIAVIRPRFVVLDPLYMMFGDVDENSAKEVGDILRWLTSLRNKYQCSLLICHHYNKAGKDSTRGGQRIRGTGAFHAWVESALYIKATTEEAKVKIDREFRSFPPMSEIELDMELGDPGELMYAPRIYTHTNVKSSEMNMKKEQIMDVVATMSRTKAEIKALTKLSRRDIDNGLNELVSEGIVCKMGTGSKSDPLKFRVSADR